MKIEELKRRRSVRSYSPTPLTEQQIAAIKAAITAVNSHEAGLHFSLVTNSSEAFKGFGRSYGMLRGVNNYIVLAIDSSSYDYMEEKAGYYAQMLVTKIVAMGLGTCFVGGTFSRKHVGVPMRAGWTIPAVITLGYPAVTADSTIARLAKKIAKRHSKSPEEFYCDNGLTITDAYKLFPMLPQALEAVSCAPSALNKQPETFAVTENCNRIKYDDTEYEIMDAEAQMRRELSSNKTEQIHLSRNPHYIIEARVKQPSQHIDLGIAMWNFEQLFAGYWLWGNPAIFLPADTK